MKEKDNTKKAVKHQSTEEYLREILGDRIKTTVESLVAKEVFAV